MCVEHASLIDDPATLSAYPSERLRECKDRQLDEYDRIQQNWAVDADMAQEAIGASFRNVVVVLNSTLNLGGEGGRAPGAGGGGGGAIGQGARAGNAGRGGDRLFDMGEFTIPVGNETSVATLLDTLAHENIPLDFAPGAGGGGCGASGEGVIAGDGGESVTTLIDIQALRQVGFHHFEFEVGSGGKPASMRYGALAGDGGDVVLRAVTEVGTVLKTIRAAGGRAGRSAGTYVPDNVVELSPADIDGRLRITTLMTANGAELHDGRLFVFGGNWITANVPSFHSISSC